VLTLLLLLLLTLVLAGCRTDRLRIQSYDGLQRRQGNGALQKVQASPPAAPVSLQTRLRARRRHGHGATDTARRER